MRPSRLPFVFTAACLVACGSESVSALAPTDSVESVAPPDAAPHDPPAIGTDAASSSNDGGGAGPSDADTDPGDPPGDDSGAGDASVPDGGNDGGGGDGGPLAPIDRTCAPVVLEAPVPAAGALVAEDLRAIVFLANGTQWTRVAGGAGTTETSAKPAGLSALTLVRSEITPAGRVLVHYTAGGKAFAALFEAGAYTQIAELPPGTTEVHADASGRYHALDADKVLHEQSSVGAAFANVGALPLSIFGSQIALAIDEAGTTHLARAGENGGKSNLEMLRKPLGGAWSAAVLVHQTDTASPLDRPRLATGLDGSIHVAWRRRFSSIAPPNNYYSRSATGATWSVPDLIASSVTVLALEARSYDTAQALLESQDGIAGFGAHWANRCGPSTAQGWPRVTLATDPASYATAEMRASPSGRPVFLLSQKDTGRIVVRVD